MAIIISGKDTSAAIRAELKTEVELIANCRALDQAILAHHESVAVNMFAANIIQQIRMLAINKHIDSFDNI